MEQSELAAARVAKSSWRGWLVAAVLIVSTVAVLYGAAPWLLYFEEGDAGSTRVMSGVVWDAELPDHVSPGELQFTVDATFDEEPPYRGAMLEVMPVSIAQLRPGRAGPPIVGRAQLQVSRIERERSGIRPFFAEEKWEVGVSFQFEGSCDGHPIRCRGTYSAFSRMNVAGLRSGDEFERELAKLLASMIADELGLTVETGRKLRW